MLLQIYLTNLKNFHVYFRNYIYNYIKININKLEHEYPYINRNNIIIILNEYMQNINNAGEIEILVTAKFFDINILIP